MEKLKEIMSNHLICSEDESLESIEFVRELLEAQAEETKAKEPYATNSIRRMEIAAREVDELAFIF